MKTNKMITVALTVTMMTSAMQSFNVFADNDEYVYSGIDSNGTEIGYTQADLDEAHWDTEKLGSENPIIGLILNKDN